MSSLLGFSFLSPPRPSVVVGTLRRLCLLKTLGRYNRLASINEHVTRLPLRPVVSGAVLTSRGCGYLRRIVDVVTVLSIRATLFSGIGSGGKGKSSQGMFSYRRNSRLLLLSV